MILVGGSWITVACAFLTALWSVPQQLFTGTVTLSTHPLFPVLFLFPAQIGVPVSLLIALNAVLLLFRRQVGTIAHRFLAGGQILTAVLLVLCALSLVLPSGAGREFIVMAAAFQIGQVFVALGLAVHLVRSRWGRRRPPSLRPGTDEPPT